MSDMSPGRFCRHMDHKCPHPQFIQCGEEHPGDLKTAIRTNQWGIIPGQQVSEDTCLSGPCCKTQLSSLLHALMLQAGYENIINSS